MEELMTDEELEIYLESGFLRPSRFKADSAPALQAAERLDAHHENEYGSGRDTSASS